MSQTLRMFREWIRDGLRQPGKTQVGLAKALGLDPSAVSRLVRGERELLANEIQKAAGYLGTAPPIVSQRIIESVQTVPVRYVVARGVWRERDTVPFRSLSNLPVVVDPRWSQIEQWAAQLDTTTSYIICVTYSQARPMPRPDDLVLVERSRGDLIEHALYTVTLNGDGRWVLKAKDAPSVEIPMEDTSIKLLGLCIGRFESFTS